MEIFCQPLKPLKNKGFNFFCQKYFEKLLSNIE